MRLDPQLGRVGRNVTAHGHAAVVFVLVHADLNNAGGVVVGRWGVKKRLEKKRVERKEKNKTNQNKKGRVGKHCKKKKHFFTSRGKREEGRTKETKKRGWIKNGENGDKKEGKKSWKNKKRIQKAKKNRTVPNSNHQ